MSNQGIRTSCSSEVPRQLSGKIALITGASSGIGHAVALHLAKTGVSLALGARRIEKLDSLKSKIEETSAVKVITFKVDVTKRDEVKAFAKEAENLLGPIDILVCNAGVMHYTKMQNVYEDKWEEEVDVNIKGVLNSVGAVLQNMTKRKSGHIVFMSSDSGRDPFEGLAVYCGTKYFIEGLAKTMRKELVSQKIRITCIQPGNTTTELFQKAYDKKDFDVDSPVVEEVLHVDDVAQAVIYAVSTPDNVAVNEILIQPQSEPSPP